MAWTNDAEERKKALFSVLRVGLPFLVWDNIPRGTVIGCPHIDRASTTEIYQDRILGVSESQAAPAYTIIAFTGNNIGPKSDTASRSLVVRLGTDRPDPENRIFAHDDPVVWTLDHRGRILNAFYTIMLGNPNGGGPGQTRFKTWWNLVGSAVENAAFEATGAALSFKDMFERVEAEDEDAISRAGILKTLHAVWPDKAFTTADVAERLRQIAERVRNGEPEEPDLAELRRFCTARRATSPTPKVDQPRAQVDRGRADSRQWLDHDHVDEGEQRYPCGQLHCRARQPHQLRGEIQNHADVCSYVLHVRSEVRWANNRNTKSL
jgi:hypothetical protein